MAGKGTTIMEKWKVWMHRVVGKSLMLAPLTGEGMEKDVQMQTAQFSAAMIALWPVKGSQVASSAPKQRRFVKHALNTIQLTAG